jgi:hypothetical protein
VSNASAELSPPRAAAALPRLTSIPVMGYGKARNNFISRLSRGWDEREEFMNFSTYL